MQFFNIWVDTRPALILLLATQVGIVRGCAGTEQGQSLFLHFQDLQELLGLLNNHESLLQWNLWIYPYSNINSEQNLRQWLLRNWGWGKIYSNYVAISKITPNASKSWYWITLHSSSLSQNMATGTLSDESWSDGSTKLSAILQLNSSRSTHPLMHLKGIYFTNSAVRPFVSESSVPL